MEYRRRPPNSQPGTRRRVFIPVGEEEEPASPHYTGHQAGLHGEDAPYTTAVDVKRHMQRPAYEPDELEANQRVTQIGRGYRGTPVPMPDGVMYQSGNERVYVHNGPPPMPQRASRGKNTTAQYQIPQRSASLQGSSRARGKFRLLFVVGIALLVMVLGYAGLSALGS